VGTPLEVILDYWMRPYGAGIGDVELVELNFGEHAPALASGSVDAALSVEPFVTRLVDERYATLYQRSDQINPGHQVSEVFYAAPWVSEQPEVGRRFMVAYLKAVRFYNDALKDGKLAGPHATEILKIFSEVTKLSDATILAGLTPNGVNPNGKLDLISMRKDFQFFLQSGLIAANVKPEDAIDLSFLTDALKQLGPYR
jgi:NitT/TauT family transport system substrate-binding protein